jgi:hypothetical protein
VKNSSLEVILMVMLAQLEGGLREYMGVLDMANRIKREKTVTLNIFFDLSICKTILNFTICLVEFCAGINM